MLRHHTASHIDDRRRRIPPQTMLAHNPPPLIYCQTRDLPVDSLALFEGNFELICPRGAHVDDYLAG
jgi:hypothetical protein